MSDAPYTNEELREIAEDAFPERGVYCPKCRQYIPRFAVLDVEQEAALQATGIRAVIAIRKLTGCNMSFAKIWRLHPNGPHPEGDGPPCPYCDRLLFHEDSRQCIKCGWDWHDPENPIQHPVYPVGRTAPVRPAPGVDSP